MSETDAPQTEGQEPTPAPETKVETKEVKTFDEDYVKQLRAEAAKYRTEAQEAKGKVSEYEEATKTGQEKLEGKVSTLGSENKSLKTENARLRVALKKGLTGDKAELADRLRGETPEELEADADKLLSFVKTEEKTPDFDGGARTPAPEPESPEQEHDKTVLQMLGLIQ